MPTIALSARRISSGQSMWNALWKRSKLWALNLAIFLTFFNDNNITCQKAVSHFNMQIRPQLRSENPESQKLLRIFLCLSRKLQLEKQKNKIECTMYLLPSIRVPNCRSVPSQRETIFALGLRNNPALKILFSVFYFLLFSQSLSIIDWILSRLR